MGRNDERAIEESARGPDGETSHRRVRTHREPHRNPLCRSLVDANPHWTDPPQEDALLAWRFKFADGEIALFGASFGGVVTQGSFDDGRSRQARVVRRIGKHERNAVARQRTVDAVLALLPKDVVDVLRLTYGPLRYVPGSPYWHSTVVQRLGPRAPVMPLTPHCRHLFDDDYTAAGRWLVEMIAPSKMKAKDVETVQRVDREAEALVFECTNRWRDARGRRKRVEYVFGDDTDRRDD